LMSRLSKKTTDTRIKERPVSQHRQTEFSVLIGFKKASLLS